MVFPPTLVRFRPRRLPGFVRWHAGRVRPVRTVLATGPALVAALLLGGCGTATGTAEPTGVDTLVVPTPSPSPDDFAGGVDHRWAPFRPGARWDYEVSGPDGVGRRTVTVGETTTVAGVPATAVRTEVVDPAGGRETVVRWYAQDRAGHLWLLGEEDEEAEGWLLGESTDAAGLAVPESPRRGDGYVAADVPGTVERTVRVAEVDAEITVPAGEYDDVVRLVVTDRRRDAEEHVHLAPGVGEVLRLSDAGRVRSVLVSHTPGD